MWSQPPPRRISILIWAANCEQRRSGSEILLPTRRHAACEEGLVAIQRLKMEKAFQTLDILETAGLVTRYAIGGAFALSFYTKPIVTETLTSTSLQPSPQFRRIARAVKKRDDVYRTQLDRIINAVRESLEGCFVATGRRETKSFGRLQYLLKHCIDFNSELIAQPRLMTFIPCRRVLEFQPSERRENDFTPHALRLFKRSWSSDCTVSQGMPRSGCSRSSSARRSSSAICSGVSSSSNFSRSCSKTSRCSSNGSRFICSKTCVALMAGIYRGARAEQAGISSPARCTFGGG